MAKTTSLSEVLRPYVERHALAGAVMLVVSSNRILSLEAIGYSDVSAKKLMEVDTLFWIASVSKPITATAVMMLVDGGRVRLDDPVEEYLPEFAPQIIALVSGGSQVVLQRPQHAITVRHLLSHTGGLSFASSIEFPTLDLYPLATRVQSYALQPLLFEPGSDWSYSNAGINTAARIVEIVSRMPFQEFLQERLFAPLGMKDTTFWPTRAQLARLAKSYKPNSAGTDLEETVVTQLRYPLTDRAHRYPMPAGGLFSTAGDLARFCQMILNGGSLGNELYLKEASIQEMSRGQLDAGAFKNIPSVYGNAYGLGWFLGPAGVFGHPGAYSNDIRVDPVHGIATAWLVQHAGYPGQGAKSKEAFEEVVETLYRDGGRSPRRQAE
jgi:CubicO group peptidase (beta-lactamase class C family)